MVKSTGCSPRRPGFNSQTHTEAHRYLELQHQGIECPLLTPTGTRHTCSAQPYTHMQNKINKNSSLGLVLLHGLELPWIVPFLHYVVSRLVIHGVRPRSVIFSSTRKCLGTVGYFNTAILSSVQSPGEMSPLFQILPAQVRQDWL